MRRIPLENWSRRDHFETYSSFEQPHFSMCANMDVTSLYPWSKQNGHSFSVIVVYVISRTANSIPEFRQRIREDGVIEHDVVHPSSTILTEGDLFSYCTFEFVKDFAAFASHATEVIAHMKDNPTLKDEPGRDDLLFMTAIPWVSFTSFMHPLPSWPPDSVPRFAWGKRFEDGSTLKMPLAVQAHHALMDGIHMARYYAEVQELLSNPGKITGDE
jgi:chloramphenicol O-acetyltransferase type A